LVTRGWWPDSYVQAAVEQPHGIVLDGETGVHEGATVFIVREETQLVQFGERVDSVRRADHVVNVELRQITRSAARIHPGNLEFGLVHHVEGDPLSTTKKRATPRAR
jgi:hypothetical protein